MLRIIIAGGRNFNNRNMVEDHLIPLTKGLEAEEVCIISGGARGADALGESIAKQYKTGLTIYPANWDKYKNGAGHRRNAIMAANADVLLAFWDGTSPGTKSMIALAHKAGLKVHVINY